MHLLCALALRVFDFVHQTCNRLRLIEDQYELLRGIGVRPRPIRATPTGALGLSARRGLVGRQTHDRLRVIAVQHLLPHHEAVLELLSKRTFDERSASAQGRQLRLETRLDANYQKALRGRAERQSVRLRVVMQDPVRAEKVKQRLRVLGPSQSTCAECGTPFLSPVQGASSRAVLLCGDPCRADRKRRLRRERQTNGRAELVGKLAVARRHHGVKGAGYERIVDGLRNAGKEECASLAPSQRDLVQRYYGLDGHPPVSIRELGRVTGRTRSELERQLHVVVGSILGVDYVGVPCQVCGRLFVPPRRDHPRRTCTDDCSRVLRQQIVPSDRQRTAARRQGRAASAKVPASLRRRRARNGSAHNATIRLPTSGKGTTTPAYEVAEPTSRA